MPAHSRVELSERGPPEGGNSIWQQIVVGLMIATCSGSVAFGYAQATNLKDMSVMLARMALSVDHLKQDQVTDRQALDESDRRLQKDITEMRTASTEHMRVAVTLITEMSKQSSELVAFLKARHPGNP